MIMKKISIIGSLLLVFFILAEMAASLPTFLAPTFLAEGLMAGASAVSEAGIGTAGPGLGLISGLASIFKKEPRGTNPLQAYIDYVTTGSVQPQGDRVISPGYDPIAGYKDYLTTRLKLPAPQASEHEDPYLRYHRDAPIEIQQILDEIVANPDKITNYENPFSQEQWQRINRYKK